MLYFSSNATAFAPKRRGLRHQTPRRSPTKPAAYLQKTFILQPSRGYVFPKFGALQPPSANSELRRWLPYIYRELRRIPPCAARGTHVNRTAHETLCRLTIRFPAIHSKIAAPMPPTHPTRKQEYISPYETSVCAKHPNPQVEDLVSSSPPRHMPRTLPSKQPDP